MTKDQIEKILESQTKVAERNYRNYQESGVSRYQRNYRRAEDIADICQLALNASDEHQKLGSLRAEIIDLGGKAINLDHEWNEEGAKSLIHSLAVFARLQGVRDVWR